jgi:hypothetical protein
MFVPLDNTKIATGAFELFTKTEEMRARLSPAVLLIGLSIVTMSELESLLFDGAFKAADAGLRTSASINRAAVVTLLVCGFAGRETRR